jgi:hypothetical protein
MLEHLRAMGVVVVLSADDEKACATRRRSRGAG